jgi:hypothetical protein
MDGLTIGQAAFPGVIVSGPLQHFRQAGLELGGSLEVFDLAHPAGQWVPSGEIWATISKSLILND